MKRSSMMGLLALGASACWPYIPSGGVGDGTAVGDDDDDDGDDDDDLGDDDDDDVSWPDEVGNCSAPAAGPWSGHPIAAASAPVRRNPYGFDAGIGVVQGLAEGEPERIAVDERIQGAVVIAVEEPTAGSDPVSFWLADASGALLVYKGQLDFPAGQLKPGDEVDLRVREVQEYEGMPEATAISGLQVVDSGQAVWVVDVMDGGRVTYDAFPSEVVELWGEAVSRPEDCAGRDCVSVEIGAPDPVVLRVPTGSVRQGDCVHAIAATQNFRGELQVDMEHPDWLRVY